MTLTLKPGHETIYLGSFGEAWVETICHVAGCEPARGHPDTSGADWVITDPWTSEVIRVQVKTTETPEREAGGFKFDLDAKTYNKLVKGSTDSYLVLVVVHQKHPHWTNHLHGAALVQSACYFAKIEGAETSNSTSKKVSLPRYNMLTPARLVELVNDTGGA